MIAMVTDYDNWVALALAVLATIYLVLVIAFPERF